MVGSLKDNLEFPSYRQSQASQQRPLLGGAMSWGQYSINSRLKLPVRMVSPISRVSPPPFPLKGSIQLRKKCVHPYDGKGEGAFDPKAVPWEIPGLDLRALHWSKLISFSPAVPHFDSAPTHWPLMSLIHTTPAPTSGPLL